MTIFPSFRAFSAPWRFSARFHGSWSISDLKGNITFAEGKAPALLGGTLVYALGESVSVGDKSAVTLVFTPDEPANYKEKTVLVTIEVTDRIPVDVEAAISGWEYGFEPEDVNSTITKSVTIEDDEARTNSEWIILYEGENYEETETPPTNPGTYTVTVEYWDDNHFGKVSREFVISKKRISFTGLSIAEKAYNDTTKAAVVGKLALEGKVIGDDVYIPGGVSFVAEFENALIGINKVVTVEILGLDSLAGVDADKYILPEMTMTLSGSITEPDSVTAFGDDDKRLETNDIADDYDSYGDALKEVYPDANAVSSALKAKARQIFPRVGANIRLMDISVVDIPTGLNAHDGAVILIPYPDGTDMDYKFYVLHMNAHTGDIEQLEVTNTIYGIVFECDSTSPFALFWDDGSAVDYDDDDDEPSFGRNPEGNDAKPPVNPPTGVHEVPVIPYLAVLTAPIIANILRRKR